MSSRSRSRLLTRALPAAALVLVAAACGGSSPADATAPPSAETSSTTIPLASVAGAATATTTDSTASGGPSTTVDVSSIGGPGIEAALARNIMRANNDGDGYVYSLDEATCFASNLIETVGEAQLGAAGFTVGALDGDLTDDLELPAVVADAYVSALNTCTFLIPSLVTALYEPYDDAFGVERCVQAALGDGYMLRALSADLQGRPSALDDVFDAVGECASQLAPEDTRVAAPPASPEAQAALAAAIAADFLTGNADDVDEAQAACFGDAVVEDIGVALLAEYGVTVASPDLYGPDVLSFDRIDAEAVADANISCTDADQRLATQVEEESGPDALACAIESVGPDWVRQVFVESLISDESSNFDTVRGALLLCGAL